MATERRHLVAAGAVGLLVAAAGCGAISDACKAGTLAIAVTLDGTAAGADELAFTLSLDGGSEQASTLTHTPGSATGNVIVQFPRGYPTGAVIAVSVTARAGGAVVGSGRALATLSGSCQATTLTVSGDSGGGDDLSLGADLSTVDLSPLPDLRPPPPDLVCPGGGVELCFNGIDDDCDGLADCADPDCAITAVCVPSVAAPFVYGTEEAAAGNCPTPTTGAVAYQADANGGGCSSTCRCSASGCSATFAHSAPCGNPPSSPYTTIDQTTCHKLEFDTDFFISAIAGTQSCGPSGSAMPVTPPALTAALECVMPGTVGQGGCNAGQACVARGTKQCVRAPGAGVTCPSGYPNGLTWYSSYTDGRSCSCSCANGGCGATSVAFYAQNGCGGTAVNKSGFICGSPSQATANVTNGCTLSVTQSGTLQFAAANAATVCCP